MQGHGLDCGEVVEAPGDVADDAPFLLDIEELAARAPPATVAGAYGNGVLRVFDEQQMAGVGREFGNDLHARPHLFEQGPL